MSMHDTYKKAAGALVDAATIGLCVDGTVSLHPLLRDFLIEEVVDNPSMTAHLFKDNFIEEFLEQIVHQSDRVV